MYLFLNNSTPMDGDRNKLLDFLFSPDAIKLPTEYPEYKLRN